MREDILTFDPDLQESLGQTQQTIDATQEVLASVQSLAQTAVQPGSAVAGSQITGVISVATIPLASVTGAGALAARGLGANQAANTTTISAAYVQAEIVALQTTLNALIAKYNAAVT